MFLLELSIGAHVTEELYKSSNRLGQCAGDGYNNHVARMYALIAADAGEVIDSQGDQSKKMGDMLDKIAEMRKNRFANTGNGDPFGLYAKNIDDQVAKMKEQINQNESAPGGNKKSHLQMIKEMVAQMMGGGIPSGLASTNENGYVKQT